MALVWDGNTTPRRRPTLTPHWTIDLADDTRQPREHAVDCRCGQARTFHSSGRCPACRVAVTA